MTYRQNPAFLAEIAASPQTVAILELKARRAASVARATAPVVSGHFQESIHSDGASLYSTDVAAWAIEFGSVNTRAHGTLRAAAESVGARVIGRA